MAKCVKLIDLLNEYPINIDVIKTKYLELLAELTIVSNIETFIKWAALSSNILVALD